MSSKKLEQYRYMACQYGQTSRLSCPADHIAPSGSRHVSPGRLLHLTRKNAYGMCEEGENVYIDNDFKEEEEEEDEVEMENATALAKSPWRTLHLSLSLLCSSCL